MRLWGSADSFSRIRFSGIKLHFNIFEIALPSVGKYQKQNSICDQVWDRSYPHILYFEKYKFEILNALFFSCGTI